VAFELFKTRYDIIEMYITRLKKQVTSHDHNVNSHSTFAGDGLPNSVSGGTLKCGGDITGKRPLGDQSLGTEKTSDQHSAPKHGCDLFESWEKKGEDAEELLYYLT
jgi:hypothetical protein